MSDNGDDITQSPLDHQIDQAAKDKTPPQESYGGKAQTGGVIADRHIPLSDTDPVKLSSWSMAEAERVIAKDVLRTPRIKLEQFCLDLHRKQDFRLTRFVKQLIPTLKRQFLDERTKGPESNRVRDFDLQSQSMRMVTANAAAGTYQFQKTIQLPYMRKTLALDYQKVSLLKDMVTGIGSLEKAVVAKLEAIKLNTAASAPRKKSKIRRIMDNVKAIEERRIAENITDVILKGKASTYRKFVTPLTKALHHGGPNGLRRAATGPINRLRRKMRNVADSETEETSGLDKVKTRTARAAADILGKVVGSGSKLRVNPKLNDKIREKTKPYTATMARFNPYSKIDEEESLNIGIGTDAFGNRNMFDNFAEESPEHQSSNLVELLASWQKEYRSDQDKIIDHLAGINDKIANCCCPTEKDKKREAPKVAPKKPSKVTPKQPAKKNVKATKPVAREPRTTKAKSVPEVKKAAEEIVLPTSKALIPSSKRLTQTIGAKLKRGRSFGSEDFTKFSELMAKANHMDEIKSIIGKVASWLRPKTSRNTEPVYPQAPRQVTHIAGLLPPPSHFAKPREPTPETNLTHRASKFATPIKDHEDSFISKMFSKLSDKISGLTETLNAESSARTKFEKLREKWEEAREKKAKGPRKNSYEDVMQKRQKKEGPGVFKRGLDRAKLAALGVMGNLSEGNVIGATTGLLGQGLSWAGQEAAGYLGDKAAGGAKHLWGKVFRKGGKKAVEDIAEEAVEGAAKGGGKRGLMRTIGKLGFGAAKGVIGGGLKLGAKGTGFLLKKGGGLALKGAASVAPKLLKSAGPALAVGLAADAADGFIDKHTKKGGVVNRLGKTATTAASWGATGAMLGPEGAIAGAALGALYANSDLVGKALSGLAHTGMNVSRSLWDTILGHKANVNKVTGKVYHKETPSILGSMRDQFFGADAKYSKSGEIVKEGQTGLLPQIGHGMQKFIFGDKAKDGSYKPGSSILDKIGASINSTMKSFGAAIGTIPSKIMDGLKDIGTGASNLAQEAGHAVVSGAKATAAFGDRMTGGAFNLQGALTKILKLEGGSKVITDSGGVTKYGISQKGNPNLTADQIRNLTEDQARAIYAKKYTAGMNLDKYSPAVAMVALDASVNQGPAFAKKLLSQAGDDPAKMIALRRQRYQYLATRNPGKYGKYLKGWNSRMDQLAAYVGTSGGSPSPQLAANTKTTPVGTKSPATKSIIPSPTGQAWPWQKGGSTSTPQLAANTSKANVVPIKSTTTLAAAAPFLSKNPIQNPTKTPLTIPKTQKPVELAANTPAPKATSTPTVATTSKPVETPAVIPAAYTQPIPKALPTPQPSAATSAATKTIESLINALLAQTAATQANTNALTKHGSDMGDFTNKANNLTQTSVTKPASNTTAIIPMSIPTATPSNVAHVAMSMAKTSVRTGSA